MAIDRPVATALALLLVAVGPGPDGPRSAAAQGQPTSQLVGQAHAQEWEPALDLSHLRPSKASRDFRRPSCELPAGSGKFTGVCTEEISEAPKMLSFCADLVRYRACVPAHQVMWPNWNATAKDMLLKKLFKDMVELRIDRERNVTPDLYVPIHFMSNPDCVNALRNALCWHNFPKCNDVNRSLPLCSSSCNEYYSNCKYQLPGAIFPACKDAVRTSGEAATGSETDSYPPRGLFQSDVRPGPDQVLAEDRPNGAADTCSRQPTDAEIGITAEEAETKWYTTWWGIILLSLAGLVVLAILAYILIPPVLMEYLLQAGARGLRFPLRLWKSLPQIRGRKVLVVLAIVFLGLVGAGMYQIQKGGFRRWDKYQDTKSDVEYQFKAPMMIWGTQATKPLTNQQLSQLKESCTCTGNAYSSHRGLTGLLGIVVAIGWA